MAIGAALQPIRGTRPLLQGYAFPCRSGLVPRMGRKAAPMVFPDITEILQCRCPTSRSCTKTPPSW
ncbi:hypothetical protein CMV24_09440 [Pseudomonas plecoglossicida]|uniref:Uncharacterized protein n=2 Tax=Pseudomonas putida group TaxID=136845 RepID=A0A2A3M7F8_PSEDL|nr:hypothetical protein CMV24_09440 [Pseudomonas plecoglossicida]RNF92568.1 hypothetical protein EFK07_06630 [Pseudomonas putida]